MTSRTLERDLREAIAGEVRFSDGDRALYATDASNYRHTPIGVVIPRTLEDVEAAVAVCRSYGAPVLSRGGGTSLAGQCCNAAVVIDFSKYLNRVRELDAERCLARVEPGTVLDRLRDAAEPHGLTFGPDPATHRWCTLGGMIGNNSCGVHSVMARFRGPGPRTEHQVERMDVLTYDGTRLSVGATSDDELEALIGAGGRIGGIYRSLRAIRDRYASAIRERMPQMPRRVSGYNLDQLLPENGFNVARALVGSESTCVTVLDATVRLISRPKHRALLVLGYPDVFEAADHVPELLELEPLALEGMDDLLVEDLDANGLMREEDHRLLPEGGGWLLAEFGGDTAEEAERLAREAAGRVERRKGKSAPGMKIHLDPEAQVRAWKIRESGLAATAWIPGGRDNWEGWEDAAVPPEQLASYLRDLRGLYEKYGYRASLYGHFGDGCVHTRIPFDFRSEQGIRAFRAFIDDAADAVLRYGGSFSGEHGDGQARSELLPRMFGPELMNAFGEFKRVWDPDGRMNPGRIVDPMPIARNLRIAEFGRPEVKTQFRYPANERSFARATMRCVGVGECRKTDGGVMCPSYMVLREEEHTTRGRAHLLFEMVHGETVRGGWRDEHVKESLELCLSCKGCKGECPVQVDVATYKAEFASHYYSGRLRPRHAYAFGLIHWWARAASWMPRLVNFGARTRGLRGVAKLAVGIAPQREIPRFATSTFLERLEDRRAREGSTPGRRVLFWPDTFTNHLQPDIALAAVEVLERAGCRVDVPGDTLCCGRPLYEYGMLDLAKRQLRRILESLRPAIDAGVPVVGVEPSCIAVFRDELPNLFPDDEAATRLSGQTFTLAEFLDRMGYEPPRLERPLVVHGHCHDRSVLDWQRGPDLLRAMSPEVDVLDSGCCGMAGAFGFEREKYDLSVAAGERVLLPAVRAAPRDALIVADGFSCREQISQCTERRAVHLAQVIRLAQREQDKSPSTTR